MGEEQHKLIVSVSPHIKCEVTVARIMWLVTLALVPAFAASVYFFGMRSLIVQAVTIISCLGFEALTLKIMNKPITLTDGSAFLTGLLLGFNLPANIPLYVPIVGSFVAITITKHLFGGLGYNIFNPALIGRAFVLISWPKQMTSWMDPVKSITSMDVVSTATPLNVIKLAETTSQGMSTLLEQFGGSATNLYKSLLFGGVSGSLGETSALLILLGGVFLLVRGYITWHIPVSFIATVAIVAQVTGNDPVFHVLAGGLMLGAFFMATDYVTSPSVRSAQIVFGICCGLLTMLIRLKGGYPEGVMFAILIMNCFAPLLDRGMRTKTFGSVKKKKEAAA